MTTGLTVFSLVLLALLSVTVSAPANKSRSKRLPGYLSWVSKGRNTATVDDPDDDLPLQGYQRDKPADDERSPKSSKRLTSCRNGNKFLKSKLKTQKQQYKEKLIAVKKILGELMGEDFDDPSMPMKDFCTRKNQIVKVPPGEHALNDYNTGGPTGSVQVCQLSPWTDWTPLAFGTLERRRTIKKPGCGCPPEDELVEVIDIMQYLGNSSSQAFSDPKQVGSNFDEDFLNPFVNGNGNANGGNGGNTGSGGPGSNNGGTGNGGSGSSVRDILMILDSSGSIETDDFDLMKEGLVTMIDLFCGGFGPADTNHRLAIVQFASNVTVIHRFGDSQAPPDLKQKVMGLRHYKGNTCTGNALQKSMRDVFKVSAGMRDFTVKDTLIVTDGQSNCGVDIRQAAMDLQISSNVFSLGVGISQNIKAREEVKSVVSRQDPHHIFSLTRFADFKEMVDNLKRRQGNDPCMPIVSP